MEMQPYNERHMNIYFILSLGLMSAREPLWLSWQNIKMEELLITWKMLTLQQEWNFIISI